MKTITIPTDSIKKNEFIGRAVEGYLARERFDMLEANMAAKSSNEKLSHFASRLMTAWRCYESVCIFGGTSAERFEPFRHGVNALSLGCIELVGPIRRDAEMDTMTKYADIMSIWLAIACEDEREAGHEPAMMILTAILTDHFTDTIAQRALMTIGTDILTSDRAWELEEAVKAYCDGMRVEEVVRRISKFKPGERFDY